MGKVLTKYTSRGIMNSSSRVLYFKENDFLNFSALGTQLHHEQCIFITWKGKNQISLTIKIN